MQMAQNKLGRHTFRPGQPVYIAAWASVAGKKEAEGPLGHGFDIKSMDTKFGEKTWEQAEKKMQQLALNKLLQKARLNTADIDLVCSGDLLNQCIGSSFTLRNTGIPHLGLYGACSTMAQSLLLASMAVGGGYADRAVAMTSSHFAGSERQYRFPLGYGGQRTPTAQWTVTGSGAALVTAEKGPIAIESATIGTVTDLGITDAANMGPAMAPVDVKLRPCGGMHAGYTHIQRGKGPDIFLFLQTGQNNPACHWSKGQAGLPLQGSYLLLRSFRQSLRTSATMPTTSRNSTAMAASRNQVNLLALRRSLTGFQEE